MALPRSTIVMAVVACVPFGLAIRDTLNGRDVANDEAPHALEEYGREQERLWREEQEREAREEAERQRQVTELMTLVGGIAEVGEPLAKMRPGLPVEALPAAWPDTLGELGRRTGSFISLDVESHVDALYIDVAATADENTRFDWCGRVATALEARWGQVEADVWFVPPTQSRARISIDERVCQLTFDHAVPADRWLGADERSVVPMWAVGKPMAQLSAWIRGGREGDDERVGWSTLGLGAGRWRTQVVAHGRGGKVVAVESRATTTREEITALIETLTERYGEPTGGSTYVFNSKPPIAVTPHNEDVQVVIGSTPE